MKLTQNIEYLKYVLFAKWLIILFNILFSIYLILSLFKKDVEVKEKEVKKEQKIPQEEKFTPREKELLHKKKLKTKADVLINNQ